MPTSNVTRASLISRARSRDSQAWQTLVDLYGPLVAHWCYRCKLDSHATADCVQDVFAAVAKSLENYQPSNKSGSFRAWLWTITGNKIRDHLRSERRHVEAIGGSTALANLQQVVEVPDEEPTADVELERLVARGLESVRQDVEPQTWAIFQRAVLDQISTALVADEFGVSVANVRQIRSRILRRLREQLGDVVD